MNKIKPLPLFFCLIIFCSLFNIACCQGDVNVGTFKYYGVGPFNPQWIIVNDTSTRENVMLCAYVYSESYTSGTYTLKVWDVKTGTEVFTTSLSGPTYVYQAVIFDSQRVGETIDGFYVILAGYYLIRAWFINYTLRSATVIYSVSFSSPNELGAIIFSNPVYTSGYDIILLFIETYSYTRLILLKLTPTSSSAIFYTIWATSRWLHLGWLGLWVSSLNPTFLAFGGIVFGSPESPIDYGYYIVGTADLENFVNVYVTPQDTYRRGKIALRWLKVGPNPVGFFKFKYFRKIFSSSMEQYIAHFSVTDLVNMKTYYRQFTLVYKQGSGGGWIMQQTPSFKDIIIINGIMLTAETRMYGGEELYLYHGGYEKIYSVGITNNQATMRAIELAEKANDQTYIFSGYGYFKIVTDNVKIWIRAVEIPTVYYTEIPPIPPTPPRPEEPSYPSETITWVVQSLLFPVLIILLPTALLGYILGSTGAAVGLALGVGIGYMVGALPQWLLVIMAMAIGVLFFSRIGLFRIGRGGSEIEED